MSMRSKSAYTKSVMGESEEEEVMCDTIGESEMEELVPE